MLLQPQVAFLKLRYIRRRSKRIIIDSRRSRIQSFLPQLREPVKRIATDKKRNISGVLLTADGDSPVRQAEAANCEYLLEMRVSQLRQIGSGPGLSASDVNHTGAERNVDAPIVVTYKLQSLKDDKILVDERHEVQEQEHPLDPGGSAFETAVSHAVESAASACMSKLKKKS